MASASGSWRCKFAVQEGYGEGTFNDISVGREDILFFRKEDDIYIKKCSFLKLRGFFSFFSQGLLILLLCTLCTMFAAPWSLTLTLSKLSSFPSVRAARVCQSKMQEGVH